MALEDNELHCVDLTTHALCSDTSQILCSAQYRLFLDLETSQDGGAAIAPVSLNRAPVLVAI